MGRKAEYEFEAKRCLLPADHCKAKFTELLPIGIFGKRIPFFRRVKFFLQESVDRKCVKCRDLPVNDKKVVKGFGK